VSGAETPELPQPARVPRDEIAEKAAYWTSAVVDARLRETFSADAVFEASVALAALAPDPECPPEADAAACRLMLAALRVSEGDLARLAMWIEAGRADPRDLIAAAEYRGEIAGGGESAREADLDGYLTWVSGAAGRGR